MRVIRRISLWVAGAFVLSMGLNAFAQITLPISEEQVLYEVIGEFNNSGLASQQFGYFADITGLNNVFGSPHHKERDDSSLHLRDQCYDIPGCKQRSVQNR